MSEHAKPTIADVEKLVRENAQSSVSVRARNLRHDVMQLEALLRMTEDRVIQNQIKKRIRVKKEKAKATEELALAQLSRAVDKYLTAAFRGFVKSMLNRVEEEKGDAVQPREPR